MPIPDGTKFHGVSPSVDTTNRGSIGANRNRDAYAIEDFGFPITTCVDITPAQILSLGDSYIEVVPPQGEGKAIVVLSASIKMVFNSVAYDFNPGYGIGLFMYPSPSLPLYINYQSWLLTDDLNSSSDTWYSLRRWGNFFGNSPLVGNGSLLFGLEILASAPTVGDSPMQITVEYKIIE